MNYQSFTSKEKDNILMVCGAILLFNYILKIKEEAKRDLDTIKRNKEIISIYDDIVTETSKSDELQLGQDLD